MKMLVKALCLLLLCSLVACAELVNATKRACKSSTLSFLTDAAGGLTTCNVPFTFQVNGGYYVKSTFYYDANTMRTQCTGDGVFCLYISTCNQKNHCPVVKAYYANEEHTYGCPNKYGGNSAYFAGEYWDCWNV